MAKPRTKAEYEQRVEQLEGELSGLKSLLEGDDAAGRLLKESEQLKEELAALRESYNELRAKLKAQQSQGSGGDGQPAAAAYEPPAHAGDYVAADVVALRRPAKLGKHLAPRGTVLATVYYHHPDANLNYVAAAVRHDQATGTALTIDDDGEDD